MNVKNNQRARDTDERIVRAVYRQMTEEHLSLSRITVRSVCEEAEINRSTFYAHYQDVFDVVEKVERSMSERLTRSVLDTLDRATGVTDLFEQVFSFVYEYRTFYRVYFSEMHHSGVIDIAWDLLSDRIASLSYRELGYSSQKEMEYNGTFFIHGITAMLRLWLEGGCQETPKELVEILMRQYTRPNQELFMGWR